MTHVCILNIAHLSMNTGIFSEVFDLSRARTSFRHREPARTWLVLARLSTQSPSVLLP
jgi:hypothetical protein